MAGKVWLVGAGPGDAELLTLKGRRVLEEADVVVYDRLAGPGVLNFARHDAERIDVGKSGGCHPVPQGEIERILIEKAGEGKNVVRLKGGDPFLFGRGGEEMAALMERGIACEMVPGVTSPLAVPAYAGIPVTHRGCSSSVHIVTAHRRDGAPGVDYQALARLGGTLVFMMGASKLMEICQRLTGAGMDKDTPAAVIENGTTARQRRIAGTLADLPGRARDAGIQAPSIIVVGRAAALGAKLDWRSALPLAGKRVLVPSVADKKGRLPAMLRARGAEVIEVYASRTEAVDAPLPDLQGYSWLVFTSTEGVEKFWARLRAEGRDIRETGGAKIAAIGPATKKAIEARGLNVDLTPAVYGGAALGEALCNAAEGRLLLLRAESGAPELAQVLRDKALSFDEVSIYRTVPLEIDARVMEDIVMKDIDAVAFTCASSVDSLRKSCPAAGKIKAVCIGDRTAQAAREAGYETHKSKTATIEDLTNAIETAIDNN